MGHYWDIFLKGTKIIPVSTSALGVWNLTRQLAQNSFPKISNVCGNSLECSLFNCSSLQSLNISNGQYWKQNLSLLFCTRTEKMEQDGQCCYCTQITSSKHFGLKIWEKMAAPSSTKARSHHLCLNIFERAGIAVICLKVSFHSLPNIKGIKKLDKHLALATRLGLRISE